MAKNGRNSSKYSTKTPFACYECSKTFALQKSLAKHLNSPIHVSSGSNRKAVLPQKNDASKATDRKTLYDFFVPETLTETPHKVLELFNAPKLGVLSASLQNDHQPAVQKKQKKRLRNRTRSKPTPFANPVAISKRPASNLTASSLQQQIAAFADLLHRCHSELTLAENGYLIGHYQLGNYGRLAPVDLRIILTPISAVPKRAAVALDCEMVGLADGRSELARISVVDYFNGEVLIDSLVVPTEKVTDWRTEFSGITHEMIKDAIIQDKALNGWQDARSRLWEIIDAGTVLVGHALQHDLKVLKMIHTRVVDSAILAKEAVGSGVHLKWGLKRLSKDFLKMEIQNHGKKGHDSVEDARAARDVVRWCINNSAALREWALIQQIDYEEKQRKRLEIKEQRQRLLSARKVQYSETYEQKMLHCEGYRRAVLLATS